MSASPPASPGTLAATALQTQASDPLISAWVSANAGSGKTHVLARRVIRLLLRGVEPGRVLCLTYTKAAAANMANRVLRDLRKWVSLDDAALDEAILATDGGKPDAGRRARARRLFAAALETPGGLKIQTIHAFCGALLHRFPFEAGVPAGFRELDEPGRDELLARVRAGVVLEAAGRPDTPLGRAFALLVAELGDGDLDEFVAALTAHPARLAAGPTEVAALVGLPAGVEAGAIEARIVTEATIARGAWRGLGEALVAEGGNAGKRGAALLAADAAPPGAVADLYARVFLNAKGEGLADSSLGKKDSPHRPALMAERDRVAGLNALLIAARAAERTLAALTLGRAALARYEAAKRARGVLDFADLVTAARKLLNSGASAWVHYKLDQGIDHVLVDEAQDTSPEQWAVIEPLVAEFFAGEGTRPGGRERPRTLFVVGDEKQSIFSFQGADPRRFDAMRREFEARVPDSAFAHVRLRHSFRSAPRLLAAVDEVFAREAAHAGLTAQPERTVHEAIHGHLPALVELWDIEAPGEAPEVDAWQNPLDAPREDDPVSRLAGKIAAHVAARIEGRHPVATRDGVRPIRPGDFLVLVRRRGGLFEAVIRALKGAGVNVAGADRLVVARHIAVMDVMALGDALLSRDDELALACVLKSPLFGLDDDDLIELAARRTGRLHDALMARAGENPRWARAAGALARLAPEALALRPFDFYARVLGRERGRARMIARLGTEAADALDEMLNLARAYESVETPTLAGFLAFLRRGGADTKRDMEAGRDEVRVMTVHGAKGLEAPYVILADTVALPDAKLAGGLLPVESGGRPALLFARRKEDDPPAMTLARGAADAARLEEYRRLLYVALTRAETALVVCGAQGRNARKPECWYDLVRTALEPEAVEVAATGFDGTVLSWRPELELPLPAPEEAPAAVGEEILPPDPDWARLEAPTPAPRRLAPSATGPAPGAQAAESLRRGDIIHRLIAGLAPLEGAARDIAGRRLIENHAPDWPPAQREGVLAEARATLEAPELAALFVADSVPEVALAGEAVPGLAVSGRIDRLAVEAGRVLIADFKTDARPPREGEPARAEHVRQLALYVGVVEKLFPGKAVEALLVYTAGPRVHALSAGEIGAALAGLTSP
ncbi:double-strand break repair helicase AddA [Ancylobacter terrae]|uniref:double-strand break repair helicase AddA n=1 Tax=Ancylobacter sp. sgz301288 TaxID=3342077 RepID=UPI00385BE3DE